MRGAPSCQVHAAPLKPAKGWPGCSFSGLCVSGHVSHSEPQGPAGALKGVDPERRALFPPEKLSYGKEGALAFAFPRDKPQAEILCLM